MTAVPADTPVPSLERALDHWLPSHKTVTLPRGQAIVVYSGPGTEYYRGADGRASISTNATTSFYLHGKVGDWYMISYKLTNGGCRVGYISADSFIGELNARELEFACTPLYIQERVMLKDDHRTAQPDDESVPVWIEPGTQVTFLTCVEGYGGVWYYIECCINGQMIRGFITEAVRVSLY